MIRMSKNEVQYVLGNKENSKCSLPVYSDIVCGFLDALSKELRCDAEAKKYPDVITFAFWCRRSNIEQLKKNYEQRYPRVGRGCVFHVAPSNVPINFAFSLAFGLLAGNSNVVRVSEKQFPQVDIVSQAMKHVLDREEFVCLKQYITVVSYGHDKVINDNYSKGCDVRVIWGGDATIQEMRESPLPPRSTEITFADRYSFAILDEETIEMNTGEQVLALAEKFYNDTYLMDQNACSSPHFIMWQPSKEKKGRIRFWEQLGKVAERYELPAIKTIDKYTMCCEVATNQEDTVHVQTYGNQLYVVTMKKIPENIERLRGKFGLFYECDSRKLDEVIKGMSNKIQTCVTYGMDKMKIAQAVIKNGSQGIDRIVEVGDAMSIGVDWDGYDVISSLSREIIV